MNTIKLSEYRIVIKFDKDPLAVEHKNYLSKIINVYTVHDLNAWPGNPTNIFKCKNYLLGANDIVKYSDEEKCTRNVITFAVDNGSSSPSDNRKNNFLMLGKGQFMVLMVALDHQEKTFSINFTKANTKFCLTLHYNDDNSYLFVNRKEIFNLKLTIKI